MSSTDPALILLMFCTCFKDDAMANPMPIHNAGMPLGWDTSNTARHHTHTHTPPKAKGPYTLK